MGGIFGIASKVNCVNDLFFGIDYHSHLGTKRGGMAVYNSTKGFQRSIHNIEGSPFRSKFEKDIEEMNGNLGIGCISDMEPQPLMIRSHLGNYALTTVGKINNADELIDMVFKNGSCQFMEQSGGVVNPTELVAALINQADTIVDGIRYAQEKIDGSMTLLLMTKDGIYAARDLKGRTPLVLGKREDARCVSFESFAYINILFETDRELGPGEIVFFDDSHAETVMEPKKEMKICTFLWTYYGYVTSSYEGVNVEQMRYRCGEMLARRDKGIDLDYVAGIPDSGTAHAIGYANESGIRFARPFIKYTPTWPRSFMPQNQSIRNVIARMKLLPIETMITGKKLLFIDDSIVRGTQLRDKVGLLKELGVAEAHIRSASPPIMFGCKYLNFSRSNSEMDLIARQVIQDIDGNQNHLEEYCTDNSERYCKMVDEIGKRMNFTSLKFHYLKDVMQSVGIEPCQLCTYCWTGEE